MIIGVDASRSREQEVTGVESYSNHIIQAMLKASSHPEQYRLYSPQAIAFFPEAQQKIMPFPRFWTLVRLSLEMVQNPPDALFVPSHVLPFFCPEKSYTMVHDLAFLKEKKAYSLVQRFFLQWAAKRAIKKAKKILVPSLAVKKDFLQFFDIEESQLLVCPHGLSALPENRPEEKQTFLQERGLQASSFFLFVGRLEKKKNVLGLLQAWAHFVTQNPGAKLVLVGKKGHGYEEISAWMHEAKLQDSLVETGYLADSELSILLEEAKALVIPSFEEGFGLPVLQAFSKDCPVLCSAIPSLQEVAGDAALYFNPKNPKEMAGKMQEIDQKEIREKTIKAGRLRVQDFSWEKAGEKLVKLLES